MNKTYRKIAIVAITLFLFFFGTVNALEYTDVVAQKMKLESILEGHVENTLAKMIGPGRATVVVNVEPDVGKTTVQTEAWAEKKSRSGEGAAAEAEAAAAKLPKMREFLPGIPLKKELTEQAEKEELKEGGKEAEGVSKRMESVSTLPSSFIKRLSVTIILDRRIKESMIATVESVVTDLLALDPKRGDKLTVRQEKFVPAVRWWSFLGKWQFYLAMAAALFGGALFFYLFRLLRNFLKGILDVMKEARKVAPEPAPAEGMGFGFGEGEVMEEMEEGVDTGVKPPIPSVKPKEEEKMAFKPFKFLEGKDLKHFMFLIKDEPPERIAAILGYLDTAKAAQILESLPEDLKSQVSTNIIKIKETSEKFLAKMDRDLKQRIDYVVGGLDKFVEILDMVDAKVRNEIIGFLAKDNPELVEKIKQRTFTFEQVSDLDTQSLRVVLGEINTSDLAIALRRAPDNVKQRITMNLSEGGVALLREEMEFGKPATDARIEQEQAKIIGIVRRMEAEGKISIKKRDRVLLETEEYEKGKRVKLDAEEETSPSGKDTGALNNEMAFEHYNAGMEYYNAGNMNESVEEFRKSLEYNDTVWQTYQYLGSCYYSLGMEKEAIAAYRKALDLNPDNEELSEWLEARVESVEE